MERRGEGVDRRAAHQGATPRWRAAGAGGHGTTGGSNDGSSSTDGLLLIASLHRSSKWDASFSFGGSPVTDSRSAGAKLCVARIPTNDPPAKAWTQMRARDRGSNGGE